MWSGSPIPPVWLRRAAVTVLAGLAPALVQPACTSAGHSHPGSDAGTDAGDDAGRRPDAGSDAGSDAGAPYSAVLPPGYPNLGLPAVGDRALRVIGPTVLEISLVTTKAADPAPVTQWDLVDASGQASLPSPSNFVVHVGAQTVAVAQVGFKRRPLYAPLSHYDLRIGNYLYLELASPIADGAKVSVDDASQALWPSPTPYATTADPMRYGPAIHVDQTGYMPALPKRAMVGYYLGSLGELGVSAKTFTVVDTSTGEAVFHGTLAPRLDQGFAFTPAQYQGVLEADFSALEKPGQYQLEVPGMGASYPFVIDEGVAMAFARTFAQGMYNQRCGQAKSLPYTRFVDGACHIAPASVPDANAPTNQFIASNAQMPACQTAPEVTNVSGDLFPFVAPGPVGVAGGHHDAGDYSKYLMDSAFLIHTLVFAADEFPGVGDMDNLGLPESGDGKSDVLQEARWEAEFAAAMQDADGAFYYLVYPKTRAYENDVLPSHGDPQVVWPKNTYATAAATAALAEIASSPRFEKEFPSDAARYLKIAQKGWGFLQKAWSDHGQEGAYQYVYFDDSFCDADMAAWAAAALFAATGDAQYQQALEQRLPDPTDKGTYKWGWWGMWRGFGNAVRAYAFAARSGRLPASQLDAAYLAKCESEITSVGDDQLGWAQGSAYGTSLPVPTKQTDQAGWYFSATQAFDLAVAHRIDPKPEYVDAILTNIGYEGGANPVNLSYLSGLGWQRPREMVSQFFQNDRHRLPPTGIDYGNAITGFMYLSQYGGELESLAFPSDGASSGAYAFYDRYSHQFNTATEADTVNEGWGFAAIAAIAGGTSLASQSWTAQEGHIAVPASASAGKPVTVKLTAPAGVDLGRARVTWEAESEEPWVGGASFTFTPAQPGAVWIDAEAVLPDGRRVIAASNGVLHVAQ